VVNKLSKDVIFLCKVLLTEEKLKNAVFWDVSRVVLVRTDVSEERIYLQEPHDVTLQKTTFFIVTTVKP
jgi:hypothetical protein